MSSPLVQSSNYIQTGGKPESFFVDWLSLHQTHSDPLPVIDSGSVTATDTDGVLVWKTSKALHVEGSHATSVRVKCDGHTVFFDGNVSRFGRDNNLFGYDLAECIRRVNDILARYGLPPFTFGRRMPRIKKTSHGMEVDIQWTGCRVCRVDLTANFCAGTASDARAYMQWLATQQDGARIKVSTSGDCETVDFGRGSRRVYSKAYLKGPEVEKHKGSTAVAEFCNELGVIRFEVTAKATQLIDMGCQWLGDLSIEALEHLFQERRSVMTRAEHSHDDLEHLPNHLRRTARDWLAGDDLMARMSQPTFSRHRRALLKYSIDISVRRNVVQFLPRVRVITEVAPFV